MKPAELKKEYVRLRAEGQSYSSICEQLHISKSTCTKWEKALAAQIDELKRAELAELCESYSMTKEARIRRLGDTLEKINAALELDAIDAKSIVTALADLLNRVRAGEVTTEQAQKESGILAQLLKAYDTVEVKAKLDELEAIIGGRQ